ncbi:MAG: transcriptional repressor LexA [Clostridia bacterium]|nr:transcriptional repressor LexA [Clostridia bacterium]
MSKKNEDMKLKILDYISEHTKEYGYPPSVREICAKVGLSSPSTVHGYLERMSKEGMIEKDSTKTRAIRVKKEEESSPLVKAVGKEEFVEVPVVGKVAAGMPITAVENATDLFPLPSRYVKSSEVFMLKVSGESMINAGIFDGDLVIVQKQETAKNGEIVVALIEDSATVKTFYKEKNGRIRLQPENDNMEPIYPDEMQVIGKVVGLFRTMI